MRMKEHRSDGLYRGVNIPLWLLDGIIFGGLFLLAVLIFVSAVI